MDVLFYHLTESTLEEALPPLVEKSLERGWRVAIQTGSRERCEALDRGSRDRIIDRRPEPTDAPVSLKPVELCRLCRLKERRLARGLSEAEGDVHQ